MPTAHESVPQTKIRGGGLDRKEATKVMSVIASSFIVMNIVILFSLLSEPSYTCNCRPTADRIALG